MGYEARRYSIVPYMDEWPAAYERESAPVMHTLAEEIIYIDHVGSTAIPGLTAQPTIDILAVVKNIDRIDTYNFAMKAIGYDSLGAYIAPHSRFFKKDKVDEKGLEERIVNLHMFTEEHPTTIGMLAVRDYLMALPEEKKRYEEFKWKLYKKYPQNYAAYREQKDQYLEKLSKKAVKWRGSAPAEE